MRAVILVGLAASVVSQAVNTTTPTTRTRYNVYYDRQAAPSGPPAAPPQPPPPAAAPPFTSSVNWGPPGGNPPASISASSPATMPVSGPASSGPAATPTQSASQSSSASSSASRSLIKLTAIPPAATFSGYTRTGKLARPVPIKLVFLIPLFSLLGITVGIVAVCILYAVTTRSAFSCCCCLSSRRARDRGDILEPGPPYKPPTIRDAFAFVGPDEKTGLTEGYGDVGRSPSKYSTHGAPYSGSGGGGSLWLSRALSTATGSIKKARGKSPFAWPAAPAEDEDPFLVPPRSALAPSRGVSTRTKASGRTDALSMYGTELDDGARTPYESLRHKSIRRGILERLQGAGAGGGARYAAMPGLDGGYADDLKTVDLDADGEESQFLCADDLRKPERSHSDRTSSSRPASRMGAGKENTSTAWIAGSGFRMVSEDPSQLPSLDRSSFWGSPSKEKYIGWKSYGADEVEEDKFTPLPVRRARSRSPERPYSPPSRCPVSPSPQPRASANRYPNKLAYTPSYVAALPCSPPRITSPPLESKLFFTPTIPQGSVPSMVASPDPKKQPTSAKRSATKLKTSKPPPALPYPAAAKSPPQHRPHYAKAADVKGSPLSPPRRGSPSTRTPASGEPSFARATGSSSAKAQARKSVQPVSAQPSINSRGTPAERYTARMGALRKVDDIVERSWSGRDVGGARSPTLFGAADMNGQRKVVDLRAVGARRPA
ncbi:hypothetical protein PLICRDRAFT_57400 [Plicaturopsis crispa FD-325 SS-3]|uniref:Uncharacterized protein n=1 Tax=Plicaturopsis crispa FD-325 SS-3 TaxID=944288 RepID=A0A0C9SL54_PLICR|nr:hypothetical protein PLICRDRAFT_57400 [Plicaturopsis crispa FD-325 SS-3]